MSGKQLIAVAARDNNPIVILGCRDVPWKRRGYTTAQFAEVTRIMGAESVDAGRASACCTSRPFSK